MRLPRGVRVTGTRLDPILASVVARAASRAKAGAPETGQEPCAANFRAALAGPGLGFIAECKRRAPSAGELSGEADLAARAEAYARGGAVALSILTEDEHFGGHARDLVAVTSSGLPRLRKDFLISSAMVIESARLGADGVLLICACLDPSLLEELAACARERGLFTLLEIHDEAELGLALEFAPDAIGVNSRDLRDFTIDLGTAERLLPLIPEGVLSVAESGLTNTADFARVAAAGADAALVGTALMRAEDPAGLLRTWREELS